MSGATTNDPSARDPTALDPTALALRALAAPLSNQRLAARFLSLSGIGPPDLRQRASDPDLLCALLRFLEAHEPDLMTVAGEIGVKPGALVAARRELEQ